MGIPGKLYHVEGIYINVSGDYTEKASLLPTAAGNFQLVHLNWKTFHSDNWKYILFDVEQSSLIVNIRVAVQSDDFIL